MEIHHHHAAGIDIGSKSIFISVEGKEVVHFGTFTCDFQSASQYLVSHNVKTVAMEATGSYWFILHNILEYAGIDVWVVDGRQTRQVPGRKTDVKDCQWIQQLHSYGLLNKCFVVEGVIKSLRSYQRLREDHIRSASMHIQHMQKALLEMNIRLAEVLDQIHGASGMAIIKAILQGERDPHKLLSLCHVSVIKNKSEQIIKSLEGFYSAEGLFALKQGHDAYFFYQDQISACDAEMEKLLQQITKSKSSRETETKRKPIRHNKPEVDHLGEHLLKMFDYRDATILPGLTDYTWLQIASETGTDLMRWKSEKHFASWLGLSPGQNDSGKKKKRSKKKGKPKAGQIFRIIAQGLLASKKIAFGEFGRRLRARKGPEIAVKAVARKLAIQYWRLMVKGKEFVEKGVADYKELLQKRKEKYFHKLAKELDIKIEVKTVAA